MKDAVSSDIKVFLALGLTKIQVVLLWNVLFRFHNSGQVSFFDSHGHSLLMLDAAHSVVCESVFLVVIFQPC